MESSEGESFIFPTTQFDPACFSLSPRALDIDTECELLSLVNFFLTDFLSMFDDANAKVKSRKIEKLFPFSSRVVCRIFVIVDRMCQKRGFSISKLVSVVGLRKVTPQTLLLA